MIRLLIRTAVNLISAAIGVLVATAFLKNMTVSPSGFVLAVVIFALAQAILTPFVFKVIRRNADAFLGGVGIVSTLVALILASLIGDSITIVGISTWIAASVIVWFAAAIASLFVPFLLVKLGVQEARRNRDSN